MNCQLCTRSLKVVALALVALLSTDVEGITQENMETTEAVLRYRRVYVEADRPEDWPRDASGYLPMDPAEFERLLRRAAAADAQSEALASTRITAAEYEARLIDDHWAQGRAVLQIAHSAPASTLLSLEPCGLAIGQASWVPAEAPASAPLSAADVALVEAGAALAEAVVGLQSNGDLAALVERSGRLELEWSLSGVRDEHGGLSFRLDLPPCSASRLLLHIPANLKPVVDRGVLLDQGEDQTGFRQWRVELGGHHRADLRIVPIGEAARQSYPAFVKESLRYSVLARGLDAVATFDIEAPMEPLSQVTLAIDSDLQIVSLKYGNEPIKWSLIPGGGGDTGHGQPMDEIVARLPDAILGTSDKLTIRALAPLDMGRRVRLPRIIPREVFWQETEARLLVPETLQMTHLEPINCRQSGGDRLPPSGRDGESENFRYFDFQYFAADSTVEVAFSRRSLDVNIDTGTSVGLNSAEATAHVIADFESGEVPVFELTANIQAPWLIDSVESIPSNALEDWALDTLPEGSRLTVRLSEGLSSSAPLKLSISARLPQSLLGQEFGLSDLVPLRFQLPGKWQPEDQMQFVEVHAEERHEVKILSEKHPRQVSAQNLTPGQRELFAETPRGHLFIEDPATSEVKLSLTPRVPSYSGVLHLDVTAGDDILREHYTLRCEPESTRINRVLVHFSRRRDGALHWTLGKDDDRRLSARALLPEEQTTLGLNPEEETWEVQLGLSRSQPFDIQAIRTTPMSPDQPISLVCLPEASSQRATLTIRVVDEKGIRIKPWHLTPIPVREDGHLAVQAAYRYQPSWSTAGFEASATVTSQEQSVVAPSWVWNCHIDSRYEGDGSVRHLVSYHIQNAGDHRLELDLSIIPGLKEIGGIWVNGKRARGRITRESLLNEDDGLLLIDLPTEVPFPTLMVQFTTSEGISGPFGVLHPPMPDVDIPIISRHWTAWLPPGYRAESGDIHWQPPRAPRLGWRQRLFGPLGRAVGDRPFDPFSVDTWSPHAADFNAQNLSERRCEQCLRALGDSISKHGNQELATDERADLDWETLLSEAAEKNPRLTFLLDRQAVAKLGLLPKGHVPLDAMRGEIASATEENSARAAINLGASLIQAAHLAVLVHDRVVLITSQTKAALFHAYLTALDRPHAWRVLPGPLADQVDHAIAPRTTTADRQTESTRGDYVAPLKGQTNGAYVLIDVWKQLPAGPSSRWNENDLASFDPANATGWAAFRMELPDGPLVQLDYYHTRTIETFRLTSLLLVSAMLWWVARDRPVVLALFAGLFGIAALLLPEAYCPVASGGFLAAIFGLVFRGIYRERNRRGEVEHTLNNATGSRVTGPCDTTFSKPTLGIVFLVALSLSDHAFAADASLPPKTTVLDQTATVPAKRQPVHRVLIPIDKDQNPTGERFHVPRSFCEQLHLRAGPEVQSHPTWVIREAIYRGTLTRRSTPEQLALDRLRAAFSIEVFSPAARVRIPLGQVGSSLLPNGTFLDGRMVQPELELNGKALVFNIAQPGTYRLELLLAPTAFSGKEEAGFDVAIPRLARSHVELTAPLNSPPVTVVSALGATRIEEEPPRVFAQLGPSKQLRVRWPKDGGIDAATPVDVAELLWMRVQPGGIVTVDARLKINVVDAPISQLQLAVDPELMLLRVTGNGARPARTSIVGETSQLITLQWPEPISGKSNIVDLKFKLKDTSGVGNLRLPELKTLRAKAVRRWMAVSVDSALAYEISNPDSLEPDVPGFMVNWGEAEAQPLVAYRLASLPSVWSMATHPRRPTANIKETLTLSFDQRSADVFFQAQLITTAGYDFQHRLLAPPELTIESVSVMENDTERVAQFAQHKDGTVTILLTELVSGTQTVSLRGRLPCPQDGKLPLPWIRVDRGRSHVTTLVSHIDIYRRPTALVSIEPLTGVDFISGPTLDAEKDSRGQLAGRFRVRENEVPRVWIQVDPNHTTLKGTQVIRLDNKEGTWRVRSDWDLRAQEGIVDEFRISTPMPFDVSRAETLSGTLLPVEQITERETCLLLSPSPTTGKNHRIAITGPLAISVGDRPRVPRITLAYAEAIDSYVLLPNHLDGRPANWELQRLEEATLPESIAKTTDVTGYSVYRKTGEKFEALLDEMHGQRRRARVRLADVRIAWNADRTCRGVATFDLTAGNLEPCRLVLPPNSRLVYVSVGGVPVTPIATEAINEWQLPWGPTHLPRRVAVVYTGALDRFTPTTGQRLRMPTLEGLLVGQTLWTVVGPPRYVPTEHEDTDPIVPWRLDLSRVRNAAAILTSVADNTLRPPEEVRPWYRRWAGYLAASQAGLRQSLSSTKGNSSFIEDLHKELSLIEQHQETVAEKLGVSDLHTEISTAMPVVDTPHEIWQWWPDRRQATPRCSLASNYPTVTIAYRLADSGRKPSQTMPMAVLVLTVVSVIFGLRRGSLATHFHRWPHAAGVIVGLSWWLWMSPSIVGWIITVVSFASAIFLGWKSSPRSSGSTIISTPKSS